MGWWRDNPITRHPDAAEARWWLAGNTNTPTAGWHSLPIDPAKLLDLPGKMGEHRVRGQEYSVALVARLVESIRNNGYDPDSTPLICIEANGDAFVYEGNHRIRAAAQVGVASIPVDVRYLGGAEELPGAWTPPGVELPIRATIRVDDAAPALG
jgi:hypothetical protein